MKLVIFQFLSTSLNWTHVIHAHDHDQFMIMIIIHIKHIVTGKVGKFSRQIGKKSRRWQNLTRNYLYMPVVTGHAWSEFCSDLHAVFFVGKPKKFSTSMLQYNMPQWTHRRFTREITCIPDLSKRNSPVVICLYMLVHTGHAWGEFCSDLHAVFFVGKPKKFSTSTLQYNDISLMDPPSFYKGNNVYTGFI